MTSKLSYQQCDRYQSGIAIPLMERQTWRGLATMAQLFERFGKHAWD